MAGLDWLNSSRAEGYQPESPNHYQPCISSLPLPLEIANFFVLLPDDLRHFSRKVIQGAWLDTSGRATKREGAERYPIEWVHTLSVANMAAVPEVIEPTIERAQQVLSDRLASNVLRMIQGKVGR